MMLRQTVTVEVQSVGGNCQARVANPQLKTASLGRRLWRYVVILVALMQLAFGLGVIGGVQAADIPAKPAAGSYIADTANVLSPEAERRMNVLARELDDKTGAQLAILTVKTLDGASPDEYALQVLRSWGIGQKKENNGMLLLVSTEDKRVRIEVGYGLEGIMNDAKAGQILDTYALPYFRQGDWQTGIVKTFVAMATVTAKEYNVSLTGKDTGNMRSADNGVQGQDTPWPLWQKILVGVAVVGFLAVDIFFFGGQMTMMLIMLLSRGRGGGNGGRGGFGGGSGGGGGAGRGW